jgi:hypothetical protein
MGRRYLSVLLKLFFDKMLVSDDIMSERLSKRAEFENGARQLNERLERVESLVMALQQSRKGQHDRDDEGSREYEVSKTAQVKDLDAGL